MIIDVPEGEHPVMCLGAWLSFGRLNRVFGLDTVCQLPGRGSPH